MNQMPTQGTGTPKASYVDNTMNANAQKQANASISGMANSIDAMSRFIITNSSVVNRTLFSIDDTLEDISKEQKDYNKKFVASIKGVVSGGTVKKDLLDKKVAEDPTAKTLKTLQETLEDEFKSRKEDAKKKGMGLLAGLAGLLSFYSVLLRD